MRKVVYTVACFLLAAVGTAQEQGNNKKVSKEEKKAAKKERIAEMLRREEEGEPLYRKHSAFGIKLNNDGYGLSYEIGKIKSAYKATIFQIELNEKKHAKEEKQSTTNSVGGIIFLGNPFVYGKQNTFYQLKLGVGQQYMIGGKGNKNGVGVYSILAGGFSAGLQRPYYVEVEEPPQSGKSIFVKYTQQDSALFLGPGILGGAGFGKGWNEIKFVPGLHAKAALRFDFGRFNTTVTAIEAGFNFEYYTSKIVQMVNVEGKNFFANGYLTVIFGKRK